MLKSAIAVSLLPYRRSHSESDVLTNKSRIFLETGVSYLETVPRIAGRFKCNCSPVMKAP